MWLVDKSPQLCSSVALVLFPNMLDLKKYKLKYINNNCEPERTHYVQEVTGLIQKQSQYKL